VERKLYLQSDPPDAVVFLDGRPQGKTPVEVEFHYYGTRQVELRHEGFRPRRELIEVEAPWFQYLPIDFFFDVLWPWTLVDAQTFHFTLEPYLPSQLEQGEREELLEKADELRFGAFTR